MTKINRRASWLELFYDLVFVIVIAKLSHFLLVTPSFHGLMVFTALFFMTWWVWMGYSYFADMYERDHWAFRGILYLSMIGIIIYSINVQNLILGNYKLVILSYMSLRLLLWSTYVFTWWHYKADRPFLIFYVVGFGAGILLWGLGLTTMPATLILCGIGFLVEFATPALAYAFAKITPKQVSHLDERFGLFLLIVLGETIASVTFATEESNWGWHNTAICIASFVIAISMWKLYFSRIQEATVYNALRGTRLSMMRSFAFGNSHIFIAIAIVTFGVSLEWIVLKETSLNALSAYTMSLALYVFMVTFNQWASHALNDKKKIFARVLAVIIILVMGYFINNAQILSLALAILWQVGLFSQNLLKA